MMHRPTAWPLAAALLAALLLAAGCAGSGNTLPQAPEETSTESAGAAETPEGTETLDFSGEDFEIVAVGPELTRSEERGRMLFRHYCAHCHGASGAGDGQNSFGLETAPRDLLAVEIDSLTDEHLRLVITEGGTARGLSRLMPPWGHTLEPHRIDDLVKLIRVLPDLEGLDEDGDIPTLDDDGVIDGDMGDFSL